MNYSYFSYTRVIAAVALFAGVILLWPGKLFFLNDDFIHLHLTSQGKWLQQHSFRPVCDLSMWLDYKIWRLNAVGFHLTNAFLHLFNTVLVYRLALRLLQQYHQAAVASSNAMLIAAIFFVYAFHAETLYWVIGRSASLGALFFLLSMIWYLRRHDATRNFYFSLLFLFIGLLTYESTWITPLAFVIVSAMDVRLNRSAWKKEWRYVGIGGIALIVYFILRYISIDQFVASYEGDRFLRFDFRGLAINYLKLILRSFSKQTGDLYLIGAAFLIGITALISFLITRRKIITAGMILLWLTSYLPYLSLGIDTFGSEGERYLYLPSIFLTMIIGLGIVNASRVYKYVISLLFFTVHILLLYDARRNYETASAVTETTIKELSAIKPPRVIYLVALPKENNGALIFRDGFEAATHLFPQAGLYIKKHSTYDGNYTFFNGVSENDQAGISGQQDAEVVFDYSNHSLVITYLPAGTISE